MHTSMAFGCKTIKKLIVTICIQQGLVLHGAKHNTEGILTEYLKYNLHDSV